MADSEATRLDDTRDAFFSVTGQEQGIGKRAGNASRLVLAAAALKFALHLAGVAIIARLVPPDEFGVAALAMPIVLIATQLSQFGLAEPIVQRPEIKHNTVSALFWFNFAFGLGLGGLVFLLGWPAVHFYDEPRVIGVFHAMALSILFAAISTMYIAILRRRMDFRLLEGSQLLAFTLSILLAIFAAWLGAGYWAVVIQYGSQSVFLVLMLAVMCRWRPSSPFGLDFSGIAKLLAFGGNMAGASVVAKITQSIPVILTGRLLDTAAAGNYYRGFTLANLIPQRVTAPLSGVFVSTLSRLHSDPVAYRAMAARIISRLDLILMPVGVGMACGSDLIVRIVLGPNWGETAPLLAWMSVIALQSTALQCSNWFLISSGASKEVRNFAIFGMITTGLVAILASPYGLVAMTAAYQTSSLVFRLPYLFRMLIKHTHLDAHTLLRSYGIDLALALGLICVLNLSRKLWLNEMGDTMILVVISLTIAVVYTMRLGLDAGMRQDVLKLLRRDRSLKKS